MCYFGFNVGMYGDSKKIVFRKHEIDDAFKDNRFDQEFSLEFSFQDITSEDINIMPKGKKDLSDILVDTHEEIFVRGDEEFLLLDKEPNNSSVEHVFFGDDDDDDQIKHSPLEIEDLYYRPRVNYNYDGSINFNPLTGSQQGNLFFFLIIFFIFIFIFFLIFSFLIFIF